MSVVYGERSSVRDGVGVISSEFTSIVGIEREGVCSEGVCEVGVDGSDMEGDDGVVVSGGSWLCAVGLDLTTVTMLFVFIEAEQFLKVHRQFTSPVVIRGLSFLYLKLFTSMPSLPFVVLILFIFIL